jgi:hypothetical protein
LHDQIVIGGAGSISKSVDFKKTHDKKLNFWSNKSNMADSCETVKPPELNLPPCQDFTREFKNSKFFVAFGRNHRGRNRSPSAVRGGLPPNPLGYNYGMTHKILEALKSTDLWGKLISLADHHSLLSFKTRIPCAKSIVFDSCRAGARGRGPSSCVNDTWPLTENFRIKAFIPFV